MPRQLGAQYPRKPIMIEIIVKECCTTGVPDAKVTELTLFPTEKDIWGWDPFATHQGTFAQATFSNLQEMLLFEIDRLLKKEAKEAEKTVA